MNNAIYYQNNVKTKATDRYDIIDIKYWWLNSGLILLHCNKN